MRLAYLLNAYPMTSTTFIPREIAAIEALGQPVARYAVRPWDGPLVDENDRQEQAKTTYILVGNAVGLAWAFLAELVARPLAVWSCFVLAARIWRESSGGIVRHAAYLLEAIWFARRARAEKIDHVHVHFATNAATVALLAKTLGGPRYSLTVHGPDELIDAPWLSFERKIAAAEFVAAISWHCRSQILRWCGFEHASKIHVIRCGLFLEEFEVTPPPDAHHLICVGRLCPQKGQEMLPEAAEALAEDFPGLTITLVGDGPSRPAIERAIRDRGLENRFELVGWLDNTQVRARMKIARALVLPTFAEGLPVVIMEALALGRPVVSTWIAGIPELVDESCGRLVPAGAPEALAAALREILAAPTEILARLGAEGRARVAERHHQSREAERLLEQMRAAAEA